MSEVLEGLLQKRSSLSAELRALDAGIAAYRHALVPTKSTAVPTKNAAVRVNSNRPTMSLAARNCARRTVYDLVVREHGPRNRKTFLRFNWKRRERSGSGGNYNQSECTVQKVQVPNGPTWWKAAVWHP